MDNPADLINAAIAELVHQRCELPAFRTLNDLSRRVCSLVNQRCFGLVLRQTSSLDQFRLDQFLETDKSIGQSEFNRLKQTPKRPTLSHLRQLQEQLKWLLSFEAVEAGLAGIPNSKIRHFAAEAKLLDADAMQQDVAMPKRYTLLLCLIHQAQVTACNNLVEMFLRRISRIHIRGKQALEALRLEQRSKTEHLIGVLANILKTTTASEDDATLGQQVRDLCTVSGGTESLLDDCEAIASYNGNNYLPLLWQFYRSHRSVLFRAVRSLDWSLD